MRLSLFLAPDSSTEIVFERRLQLKHKYTADDIRLGIIYSLKESADSPTGYRVELLVRDEVLEFDTVREVYELQFSPEFFPYPCLGEIDFDVSFDDNGVITGMKIMDLDAAGCPIKTVLKMGTYAMFDVQITDDTPRVGDILKIEDGTVILYDYEKAKADQKIVRVIRAGAMPELHDGLQIKLAPDVVVYTWDWGSALAPFSRCTREEAEARRFVTHFSVGSLDDIEKNCYWINFYSTLGDESTCDIVKVFLNKKPGWE
jgi:hypothetical protein